jgi:hypothetical protein
MQLSALFNPSLFLPASPGKVAFARMLHLIPALTANGQVKWYNQPLESLIRQRLTEGICPLARFRSRCIRFQTFLDLLSRNALGLIPYPLAFD